MIKVFIGIDRQVKVFNEERAEAEDITGA